MLHWVNIDFRACHILRMCLWMFLSMASLVSQRSLPDGGYHLDVWTELTQRSLIITTLTEGQREEGRNVQNTPLAFTFPTSQLQLLSVTALLNNAAVPCIGQESDVWCMSLSMLTAVCYTVTIHTYSKCNPVWSLCSSLLPSVCLFNSVYSWEFPPWDVFAPLMLLREVLS